MFGSVVSGEFHRRIDAGFLDTGTVLMEDIIGFLASGSPLHKHPSSIKKRRRPVLKPVPRVSLQTRIISGCLASGDTEQPTAGAPVIGVRSAQIGCGFLHTTSGHHVGQSLSTVTGITACHGVVSYSLPSIYDIIAIEAYVIGTAPLV